MKEKKFYLEQTPNCVRLNSSNIIHLALSAHKVPSGVEIRSLCGIIFPVDEYQLGEKLEGEKCSSCYYYDLEGDKKD